MSSSSQATSTQIVPESLPRDDSDDTQNNVIENPIPTFQSIRDEISIMPTPTQPLTNNEFLQLSPINTQSSHTYPSCNMMSLKYTKRDQDVIAKMTLKVSEIPPSKKRKINSIPSSEKDTQEIINIHVNEASEGIMKSGTLELQTQEQRTQKIQLGKLPYRVLARWTDKKWYPGTIISRYDPIQTPVKRPSTRGYPDEPIYDVKYDDGNLLSNLTAKDLRIFDIRPGDRLIGRVTEQRSGKVVAACIEIQSIINDKKDLFKCIAMNERSHTRIQLLSSFIRLEDICATNTQISKQWGDRIWKDEYWKNRIVEKGELERKVNLFSSSPLTCVDTEKSCFLSTIEDAKLEISNCAFVITGMMDREKVKLTKTIEKMNGIVFNSIQDFINEDLSSDVEKPFIVISGKPVRTAAFMVGLALDLPIVSYKWIENGEKPWYAFALSSGTSSILGAPSSRHPNVFKTCIMSLKERLERRRRFEQGLLYGKKCCLITNRRNTASELAFIISMCGARDVFIGEKWKRECDIILVEDERKGIKMKKGNIIIKTKTWLFDSLILGEYI